MMIDPSMSAIEVDRRLEVLGCSGVALRKKEVLEKGIADVVRSHNYCLGRRQEVNADRESEMQEVVDNGRFGGGEQQPRRSSAGES